jgi:ATP-binding cassette subfamily B protein
MRIHAAPEVYPESEPVRQIVRDGVRIIRKHLQPYRRTVTMLMVFSVVSAAANAAVPFVTGRFVDALIALSRDDAIGLLAVWVGLGLTTVFIDGWMDFVRIRLMIQAYAAYIHAGFTHLLTLPVGFHKQQKLGELNQRIGQAANALESFIGTQVVALLPQFLGIAVALVLSFVINPLLGAILIGGVSVYLLILWRITPRTIAAGKASYDAWRKGFGLAWDIGQNVFEVKQAVAEEFEERRLKDLFVDSAAGLYIQLQQLMQKLLIGQRLLVMVTQFSIFAVAVTFVISGRLTVGELVMFNAYAGMLYGPFVRLGQEWQNIQRGVIALREGEALLAEAPEAYDPEDAVHLNPLRGEVAFEHVTFRYGPEQETVLRDVSFTVPAGKTIALVGRSGVGKTTLLNLISGYMWATEGRVLVDGHDVRTLHLKTLRSQIAVVPQEPALFNDTVLANIAYPAMEEDIDTEKTKAAARLAHVDEFVARFPEGYSQIVGWRGIKLSTGQKQRIAIARAILRDPKLLMLDEPTSALDAFTEQNLIRESLAELMRGRTTFVIAHRMSTVRNADLILVLENGRIAEQGTHETLMQKARGIYRGFYELQTLPEETEQGEDAEDGRV